MTAATKLRLDDLGPHTWVQHGAGRRLGKFPVPFYVEPFDHGGCRYNLGWHSSKPAAGSVVFSSASSKTWPPIFQPASSAAPMRLFLSNCTADMAKKGLEPLLKLKLTLTMTLKMTRIKKSDCSVSTLH